MPERAGAELEREIGRLLLGEAAGNAALARDPPVDARVRLNPVIEDDGERAADVRARDLTKLRAPSGLRET